MRRWKLIAFGLGVFVLALIVTAPATLVDAKLQRAMDGRLRLAEAHGTLWFGGGQLELRDPGGRTAWAQPLGWRLQPVQLLRARLGYEIAVDPGVRPFHLSMDGSRFELADVDIALSAAALAILPKLAPLALTGDMHLQVPHLAVGRGDMQGEATLQWTAASSPLSPVSPLGDYALHMVGSGPGLALSLHTLHGPLQLNGQGTWRTDRKPEFSLIASMPSEDQPRLAPFLRMIASERGDGSFEMRLK